MQEIKLSEKLIKRYLKKKQKINLSLIVAFLIAGGISCEEVQARDLRSRNRESNQIKPDYGGPNLNSSANKIDVINIVNPNSNGISHNKFIDLSVGSGNGLIFNNSMENGTSQIGGYITKNSNLTNTANVILNEVTGNSISNINGDIEIFGTRADFILANENGISLNGATFINTNGVTLSTGKVSNTGKSIDFDVQKGNIELNGVGTSGNYFNILAKTVQIFKDISPLNGEEIPDISIIAGENKLTSKIEQLKDINIISSKKTKSDKYGIYASKFGAMYGKNIRLISSDEGLGVKHEGLIVSEKDITIDSNGDIVLTSVNSKGKLDIKGKNFITQKGISSDKENSFINSISAQGDVSLKVSENINLESALQSTDGNITIVAKNLTLADKTSARIISKKNITVNLSEKLDVQGVMIPTIPGKPNLDLIILVNEKGELEAKDIKSGKIYSSNEITWVSTGIIGTQVDIFVKEIENKGLISADKNLKIIAEKILNHKSSVIKGANINIKAENSLINRGEIRENQKELNEFVDPLGNLKIEVSFGGFENYGNISAQKISILTQKLINSFAGKIIATNGDIVLTTSIGELINNGEILTDKNVRLISESAIVNTGKIGADNILVQALKGNFLNVGQITAVKELELIVNSLVNAGNSKEIEKYLIAFYQYSEENISNVKKTIQELKNKIDSETNPEKKEALNETLKYFKDIENSLNALKEEIKNLDNLGVLSGNNVVIKATNTVENSGLLTAKTDINVKGNSFVNRGITQSERDIFIETIGNILNTSRLTAGNSISITGNSFLSTGNNETISKYLKLVASFDENRFNTIQKEIKLIEEKLLTETNISNIAALKKQLTALNSEMKQLSDIKSQISSFSELGVIETNNLAITTVNKLENAGIILTKEDATLTSKGDIRNDGVANIGGILDVKGKSFTSNNLTIGKKLKAIIDEKFETKDLKAGDDIDISASKFITSGELSTNKNLILKGDFESGKNSKTSVKNNIDILGGFKNSGEVINNGNLNIDSQDKNFVNLGKLETKGQGTIKGNKFSSSGDILIENGADFNIKKNFENQGKIQSKGNISITSNEDSTLGSIFANKNVIVKGGSGNVSVDKIQTPGNITIQTDGDIINKGMIVSNKDVELSGNSIKNENGTTIWAGQNLVLKAIKEIYNSLLAVIEGKGDVKLTAKSIVNDGGSIRSGKNMIIKTDSLINRSTIIDKPLISGYKEFETVTKWNDVLNYHLDYVKVNVPNIENTAVVKDKASINSGGDLSIEGYSNETSNVLNEAGIISSVKDMNIKGDVVNKTPYKETSIEWFLDNITVTLHWETKLYGTGAHGNSGITFKGTLREALYGNYFNGKNSYYESLKLHKDPTLVQVLSSVLGADWRAYTKPVSQDKWDTKGTFKHYASNANAQILSGGKLKHTLGVFNNDGGESGENKNVADVNIKDINSVNEIEGVKQIHDVEIITGEVTINGITIKAETGNIAGTIAVAGTINPIVFIEIPVGENGIFKPATPKPGQIQPLFETNIEFIDPNNFYGSNYFFEQIGYDKDKPSTVIGDAYYEYLLLSKMLRESVGYTGELSSDSVKELLDNALKVEKELGLEIGKPLTPQQINNLEKDIIWYVEIEINGTKVLTPQIYFSKESRLKIASNQGSGGTSTVKVGGDFTTDNTSFNNDSGNIVASGNIIVKSEGDITNNSSGGINGGITSTKGNIALDASGDINMTGGSAKGDNIIFSGNEVNIESNLGLDRDGNQIISDKASIDGHNGIQIDSKNNINIKGGSLTASGLEVIPKEEKNESSEVSSKEEEKVAVKDVNYYEELFKKDSTDIIEGAAGSINLNAGGSVNINDIQTTSSNSKNEYIDHSNYFKESSSKVTSNETKIVGSNVNINAEKDINIKGSSIGTNEGLISKDDKNEYVQGDINLNAKSNIVIEDSQESYSKKSSSAQSSVEKGLVSVKWSENETTSSLSKGSNISTSGNLNISSGNNVVLKGSNIETGSNTSINAKNNIDILDGRNTVEESTNDTRYQVLGGGNTTTEKKSSISKGSNISTGGKIELNSGNNIKIVNGTLNSSKDTEIIAKNDISIEAGKNEYSEKTTTTNVGIYVDGSAGIGGVGVSGSATTVDMSVSGEISSEWGANGIIGEKLDGSNEKTPTTSGKPHMDQLVNSEGGLKIEHSTKVVDETTWSESQLKGDNITIKAGNIVDIGGGDYEAENSVTIKGKKVDTSKYEDIRNEKTDGFTIAIKQSQGVNSSIVDTINTGVKMDAAIKSGQANEGVLAAQGIGTVTNLLFNDLIGIFSKQSANISIEKSTKNETSENITSIKGKNIDITATEGDINLNGVDIKSEENITLDAKNNINISSAKKTSSESGFKVDLEAQLEQSAGYSALWGGNTDIGIGGSANVDVTSSTSKEMINSIIKSEGNVTIKSGADTNIKGGEIEAKKDANIKVEGSLNIESQKSSYKEDSINANAGGNVSIGAASNTIGKGELGFSAGGGNLWKNGETVQQSGIKSGGNLVVDVGGDLNMSGAILGSETGNGNLKVDGNINLKDLVTNEKQGGAHITVSGGLTGDMGVDGTIGDIKDKQVTSKSVIGLNQKNINVNGDITLNGEKSNVNNIYTDLENTQIVDKEIVKVGGDISLSGSIQNVKDMKDKVNSIKDSISSSKKKGDNVDVDTNIKNINSKNIVNLENSKKFNQGDDTRTQEQKNQDDRDIIDRIIGYIGDESGELSKIKEQIGKSDENYKKTQDETIKIFDDIISQVEKENIPDVEIPKSNDSKYDILDKDNAFDFPKDDDVRVEIKDIANESIIVPEHYEPLNAMPSQKNDSSQQVGTENKKEPGYNDLLKNEQNNLNPENDKQIMEYLVKESQKSLEKSEKELIDLLNKQSELLEKQNKKRLTKKEKKELEVLEKELKKKADEVGRYKKLQENMSNNLKELLSSLEKEGPIYDEVTSLLPKDYNKNLESRISSKSLGETPLVFGISKGRKELVLIAEKSPNKNPNVADNYLGKLNLGLNFIQLTEFAKKISENTLTQKDIDDIINFSDSDYDDSPRYVDRKISAVSPEANRELLEILLKDKDVIELLKKIHKKNLEVIASNDGKKENEELNELLLKFFSKKTTIVLEKTLERDGQVYFSLDGIITNKDGEINFDKLLDVFDVNNPFYKKVTSEELRVILTKYLDNPNLKFLLGKQVIELPNNIREKIEKIRVTEKDYEAIKEYIDNLEKIVKAQEEIYIENEGDTESLKELEKIYLEKKSEFNEKVNERLKNKIKITDELKSMIGKIENITKKYENNKEEKFPEYFPKPAVEKREEIVDKNEVFTILTRNEKEIRENLDIIAKNIENIPENHLVEYLKNTIENSEFLEILRGNQNLNNKVVLKNPKLANDIITEKNLNIIYDKIYSKSDNSIRQELDVKLINELSKNHELKKLIESKETSNENLKKIALIVQDSKEKVYKDIFNQEYEKLPIIIKPANPEDLDTLGKNTSRELIIYTNSKTTIEEYFSTIVHELTHQDQKNISENEDERVGLLKELFKINKKIGGYLKRDEVEYEKQPLEKEAYSSEGFVIDKVLEEFKKQKESYDKSPEKLENKFDEKLEIRNFKENEFSIEKLYKKKGKEKLPSKSNNNIENDITINNLGKIPIVFGENILDIRNSGLKNQNNLNVKSYLGKLQVMDENGKYPAFSSLAKKYVEGNLKEEDIDDIVNYKEKYRLDDIFQHEDTDINRVPSEANRELLKEILGTQKGAQGLAKFYSAEKELEINKDDIIAKEKYEEALKEFEEAKTIIILKKTLDNNEQVYFGLDKIIVEKNGHINFENLLEVFNLDNPKYDTLEYGHLRVIFKEYLNNPNLKFLMGKQVIELPNDIKEKIMKSQKNKK